MRALVTVAKGYFEKLSTYIGQTNIQMSTLLKLNEIWLPNSQTTWEFPKIGGTLFWGPYNTDPTV